MSSKLGAAVKSLLWVSSVSSSLSPMFLPCFFYPRCVCSGEVPPLRGEGAVR